MTRTTYKGNLIDNSSHGKRRASWINKRIKKQQQQQQQQKLQQQQQQQL